MPDEYHEMYKQLTHEELHRQLMAGAPRHVSKVEAAWQRAHDAVESVAAMLRADLVRLAPQWEGPGSQEFQRRMALVVAFAQKLGDEAAALRTGLDVMSEALQETQLLVESPPAGPDTPVTAAPGVVDGSFGHVMTTEERSKARERIVTLVAKLAAEYTIADHQTWPASMPEVPPGLPGTVVVDQAGKELVRVEGVVVPETVPTLKPAVTALAGAELSTAPGGQVPGSVSLASAGAPVPHMPPAPAVMLNGAAGGLSAAHQEVRMGTDGRGVVSGGPVGAGVPPPVLGGGAGFGGRVDDGYAITDPRLAGDTGWANAEHVSWSGEDGDSPPPVLGDRTAST